MSGRVIIIVPCVSVNEYVLECLEGCLGLDYPDYRVVLVPDEDEEVPPEYRCERLHIVLSGSVSIAAKRNLAAQNFSEADYYALIDSDAYPERNWLKRGLEAFKNPGVMAAGGPNLTPPSEDTGRRAVGSALKSVLVSGGHAFLKRRSADRYCLSLHSCNMIVSAEGWRLAGGFDEALVTGEDRDFCSRLIKQGGRIYFSREAVVYHHNRRFGRHFFGQRLVHGRSIYQIARHSGIIRNTALFIPLILTVTALILLMAGLTDIFLALIALYVGAAAFEALRHADTLSEAPLVFLSIMTANSGYAAGSLLGLFGIGIDFKRLYENYRMDGR